MGYCDIRKPKSEGESKIGRFFKLLLIKFAASAIIGVVAGVYCQSKFGAKFLTVFEWFSGIAAVMLFIVIPCALNGRKRRDPLRTYTVIDIETTGLKPENDEITELAALRVREGRVVERFQELVAISGDIPKQVVEKTGITNEMLAVARKPKVVLKDFFKFVGSDLLVGYNLDSFDVPFINHHAARQFRRILNNATVDVWKLAKKKRPGLGCYKLDYIRELYGISGSGAHRALKDCEDTNEVYRVLAGAKPTKAVKVSGLQSKALKSIYRMTEHDLQTRFGDNWQIAAEIIAGKRELIASGYDQDWDKVRAGWNSSMRATENQIAMLSGLGVRLPERLSKAEASLTIDLLMLDADVKRESARRAARAQKEAEKSVRVAERAERKAEREAKRAAAAVARAEREQARAAKRAAREAELEHFDGPRMSISGKCAAKWRNEFMIMWNGILADDVIEVRELMDLKSWLNRHKRRRDDFHTMLKLIDEVVADGVVDPYEVQQLYAAAVEVLDGLSKDADEPLPEPVDQSKGYQTDAVRKVAAEVGSLFHSEFPFLDAEYSPSTRMPVCDLTNFVSEMYANSDKEALRELWCYIGGDAERVLLENSFRATSPEGLEISDYAKSELWAINALSSRMSVMQGADHATFVGIELMATTLSTRSFSLSPDLRDYVADAMRTELNHRKKTGGIAGDVEDVIARNFEAVQAGTKGCEGFANLMKTINPTSRIVITESCLGAKDSEYSRKLHFDLGYGERCYGCSGKINRETIESLDILAPYDPSEYGVPNTVTKAALQEGLSLRGVPFKKADKRDVLLRLAWAEKGLILELLSKCAPDMKMVKDELSTEALVWVNRTQNLRYIAAALLKYMQTRMMSGFNGG